MDTIQGGADLFGTVSPPHQCKSQKLPSRKERTSQSTSDQSSIDRKSSTDVEDSWNKYHSGTRGKLKIYHKEIEFIPIEKFQEFRGSRKRTRSKNWVPPKRSKNDITNFSKKSRFRMIRKMNRVQARKLSKPLFITLTARQKTFTPEKLQYQFQKSFLPKLKKVIPGACYMWKLEPHKSGKPHFHMLVWSRAGKLNINTKYWKQKIRLAWRDAINQHDRAAQLYACKIEGLVSEKNAFHYLSKYMLKESGPNEPDFFGRRWGASKNLPINPIKEITLSRKGVNRLMGTIRVLLAHRGKLNDFFNERTKRRESFFLWLRTSDLEHILKESHLGPGRNAYIRYLETGNPDIQEAEIDELEARAIAYGVQSA